MYEYELDYRDGSTVWVTTYDVFTNKLVTVEINRDLIHDITNNVQWDT